MKNQAEKKESVLGAIKKFKAEEKAKPTEQKKLLKKRKDKELSVWSSDCTDFFFV